MYWLNPCKLCQLVSHAGVVGGDTLPAVPVVAVGLLPTEPALGVSWVEPDGWVPYPYPFPLTYEVLLVSAEPLTIDGCVPGDGVLWEVLSKHENCGALAYVPVLSQLNRNTLATELSPVYTVSSPVVSAEKAYAWL